LRLSSLEPECIDENFVKVLSNKRIRPHFHLSIQSGSKEILERMGRSYNGETVEKAVSLLRRAKGDPFLACDIITGFPGETQAEFEQTFNMCKKLDFAWIHVFPYSKRKGTPAFSFTDNVHEGEVTKRVQLFTELAKQGRSDYVQRWLGKEVEVLVEKSKKGKEQRAKYCQGISANYLKVLLLCKGEVPPPGTALRCRLVEEYLIQRHGDTEEGIDVVGNEI
jgi:threonylcarbamoyladenosine tRNA methylthiotransferase MtaB